MRRRRIRRSRTTAGLSITACMNLMIVLVPFLLMSAVLNQMTFLKFNLPGPDGSSANTQKIAFDLKVIIRKESITVQNGPIVIKAIPHRNGRHNFKLLSQVLTRVKAQHQNSQAITILSEATIPYDILLQTIDASRSSRISPDGGITETELFPEIFIGDAPAQ